MPASELIVFIAAVKTGHIDIANAIMKNFLETGVDRQTDFRNSGAIPDTSTIDI